MLVNNLSTPVSFDGTTTFQNIPTTPTPPLGDNSTKLANVEYVNNNVPSNYLPLSGGTITGTKTFTSNINSTNLTSPSLLTLSKAVLNFGNNNTTWVFNNASQLISSTKKLMGSSNVANTRVQSGTFLMNATNSTITFPNAFVNIPICFACLQTTNTSVNYVGVSGTTATTCSFRISLAGYTIFWIAYGT